MTRQAILKEVQKLSPDEQRELFYEMQSGVVDGVSELTPEQTADLDKRLKEYEANPKSGRLLEDVMREWRANR